MRFPSQRDIMFTIMMKRRKNHVNFCRKLALKYAALGFTWVERLRQDESRPLLTGFFPQPASHRNLDSVRSEAELNEVINELQQEEMKKMKYQRAKAVPTPMILDPRERRAQSFWSRNGFVPDPKEEEKRQKLRNPWTEQEKEVFQAKYVKNPKQFRKIATYLPNKTVNDCVSYYYYSKMHVNYKSLLTTNKKYRGTAKATTVADEQTSISTSNSIGGLKRRSLEPAKEASSAGGKAKKPKYTGVPRELMGLAIDANWEKEKVGEDDQGSDDDVDKMHVPKADNSEVKEQNADENADQTEEPEQQAEEVEAAEDAKMEEENEPKPPQKQKEKEPSALQAGTDKGAGAAAAAAASKDWTAEEKELFLQAVDKFGRNSTSIANYVDTKVWPEKRLRV